MPKIRIFETDNTGSSPVEDLAVVFVPGTIQVKDGLLDSYDCVYIPSTASIEDYFDTNAANYLARYASTEAGTNIVMDPVHVVDYLLNLGYGIVYYQYSGTLPTSTADWDFLNDKNAYDIKFITTGDYFTVAVGDGATTVYAYAEADVADEDEFESGEYYTYSSATGEYTLADSYVASTTYYTRSDIGTENYNFGFSLPNSILPVCGKRKDCSLLVDLNYYQAGNKQIIEDVTGNALAKDYKAALEFTASNFSTNTNTNGTAESRYLIKSTTIDMDGDDIDTDVSSRAYSLFPNGTMTYSNSGKSYIITVPASIIYLSKYAEINNQTTSWLPITGVTRGVVEGEFEPDLKVSKYLLDNEIITDEAGVSFNGICTVRPYGYTIWGDRTLIEQDATKGVQATSYFSLRNLISDIAKTAYSSAIRYTYETNNETTWLNFKQVIVTLLDQMVSSGVLQTYKIGKRTSTDRERNKMIAVITLYPNLPVENFDVYVNLENAAVTTTADDIA